MDVQSALATGVIGLAFALTEANAGSDAAGVDGALRGVALGKGDVRVGQTV